MRLLPHYIHKPAKVVFWLSLAAALWFVVFWPEPDSLNMKVPAVYVDEIFSGHSAWFTWTYDNILDEIIVLALLVSGMAVMFSAGDPDDEFTEWYRVESYQWPVLLFYFLLIMAVLTVFGVGFLWLLILGFVLVLILFGLRFKHMVHKMQDKEHH